MSHLRNPIDLHLSIPSFQPSSHLSIIYLSILVSVYLSTFPPFYLSCWFGFSGEHWLIEMVLVFQDCHNKVLKMEWLKQQKFLFSQFWRLKDWDEGADRGGFHRGLSPWLADVYLLPAFTPSSFCTLLPWFPLLIMPPVILDDGPTPWPHFNLITSLKTLHPNILTLIGSNRGLSHKHEFGEGKQFNHKQWPSVKESGASKSEFYVLKVNAGNDLYRKKKKNGKEKKIFSQGDYEAKHPFL